MLRDLGRRLRAFRALRDLRVGDSRGSKAPRNIPIPSACGLHGFRRPSTRVSGLGFRVSGLGFRV